MFLQYLHSKFRDTLRWREGSEFINIENVSTKLYDEIIEFITIASFILKWIDLSKEFWLVSKKNYDNKNKPPISAWYFLPNLHYQNKLEQKYLPNKPH